MSVTPLLEMPGVSAPEAATSGYVFNHTMIRVKDLAPSLDFYTRVLGFTPVHRQDFPEVAFTIVYLVLVANRAVIPEAASERLQWVLGQPGVLELTHNHGTEHDAAFQYHHGNAEPCGFGHLCVSVPDVQQACARFEELGVPFQKRLSEGRMKHIAFIRDPDGYWIEILQPAPFIA